MSGRDGHLGDLAAALVDGALDGGTRDRALAHVAGCDPCRSEVDDQRRLKERLRRLTEPELPAGLAERFQSIAGPAGTDGGPLLRAPGSRPGAARLRRSPVAGPARPPGGAPRPGLPAPRSSRPDAGRRTRRMVGGVTALALGLVVVVALGPGRHQAPAVSPPVAQFTEEHAQTTNGLPGAEPAAGAVMTVSANR